MSRLTLHCVHATTLVDNAYCCLFYCWDQFLQLPMLPILDLFATRFPPCWLSFLSPKFACWSLLRQGPSSRCQRSGDFLVWGSALPFSFYCLIFRIFWRLLGFRECSHCSLAHCFAQGSLLEFWELCEHVQCTWYMISRYIPYFYCFSKHFASIPFYFVVYSIYIRACTVISYLFASATYRDNHNLILYLILIMRII